MVVLITNNSVHTEPRLCSEGEMDITVSSTTTQRCVRIRGEVRKMSTTETRKAAYAGITAPLRQRSRWTTGPSSSRPLVVPKSGKLLLPCQGTTRRTASSLITRTRHALPDICPGRGCLLQKLCTTTWNHIRGFSLQARGGTNMMTFMETDAIREIQVLGICKERETTEWSTDIITKNTKIDMKEAPIARGTRTLIC